MKIELEVDPGKLGQSLADILGSLTPDERRAMAKSAMENWLHEREYRASIEREFDGGDGFAPAHDEPCDCHECQLS